MASSSLAADNVWTKGEARAVGGTVHSTSGVSFVASEADFDEFDAQVVEASQFVVENLADISRLAAFPGVEYALLDFGVSMYEDSFTISCHLPPALVRIAASAGLGLAVSYYATSSEPQGES